MAKTRQDRVDAWRRFQEAQFLACLLTYGKAPPYKPLVGTQEYWDWLSNSLAFLYKRMNFTSCKRPELEAHRKRQRMLRILYEYKAWLEEQDHET